MGKQSYHYKMKTKNPKKVAAGKLGGMVRTKRKIAAAKANGKSGGRPVAVS